MAKRYVQEAGSASVRRLLRTGRIATSRLSAVEIASALARREREGAFTAAERDRALKRLNADLAVWILVELTPELTADAQHSSSSTACAQATLYNLRAAYIWSARLPSRFPLPHLTTA